MKDGYYISEMENTAILERKRRREFLYQDLGILTFLIAMAAMVLTINFTPESRQVESYVMFAVACASILLAAYRYSYLAISMAALQVLFFVTYRIYIYHAQGAPIGWISYVWVIVVLLATASMVLFQWITVQSERNYSEIITAMQDLVLIDPLTGLYNQKALYVDLERQLAHVRRNAAPITLMCVRLRYAAELRELVGKFNFEELERKISEVLENQVRVEDRIYTLDTSGTFALLLTCDAAGAEVVRKRLRLNLSDPKHYSQILNKSIRVHVQCAYVQFDPEKHKDGFQFKRMAENELQYDV